MFLGILLLLIGVLMFLDKLALIDIRIGEYILPIVLVALGISFIAGDRKKKSSG